MKKLYIVGVGNGNFEDLTIKANKALMKSECKFPVYFESIRVAGIRFQLFILSYIFSFFHHTSLGDENVRKRNFVEIVSEC